MGRLTNAITVQTAEQKGIIYFEDGNIIHSDVGDVEGEDAFYEIISWKGGEFSINKGAKAKKETIVKGWQSLMLEGLRRSDELNKDDKINPADIRKEQVAELFSKFINTKGIHVIALFDKNGKPFVTEVHKDYKKKYDIEEITKELSKLIDQEMKLGSILGLSTKREFTVEYNEGLLKLTWLPDDKEFLLLLADNSSNFGLLRIETKKYLKALGTSFNN